MADSTIKSFPFESVLSLRLLINYWEKTISSGKLPFSEGLSEAIRNAPELREPITDFSVVNKHKALVDFLMSAVIPPAQNDIDLLAATVPFRFESFFSTSAFDKNIDITRLENIAKVNVPGHSTATGKTIHACLMILNQFYNVDVNFEKPILFTIRDERTGLDKVYKIEIGKQFFEIIAKSEIKPIDPKILKFLTEKVYDLDLWLQYINPENFAFHGFMVMRMIDVTEQEMLSSIKYDLLEKNAVSQRSSFAQIQHKVRSIFDMPDIRLGVAFFGSNNQMVVNSADDTDCWKSLSNDPTGVPCDSYNGSVYERSWTEKRLVVVENLEQYQFKTPAEEQLLRNGVKNILLAPLVDGGESIGMLEIASPVPGKLNYISAAKVENALPMFTAAVKRVKEEMETDIRAIIQRECTNIHPAVEWRFIQAGTSLLAKRRSGEEAIFEEISFPDVYPLFGLADVRNSSVERANAIRLDLRENLEMIYSLLGDIYSERRLPILEETRFKAQSYLSRLESGLASGDESLILGFLKEEVGPLVMHFGSDELFSDKIDVYQKQLDLHYGVVYRRRREFEESLSMINKMISAHLDEAQKIAQQMFPHYFEKYQTDGVEYTLYLGSSLVQDKKFDPFYLKNFRLWQLMLMCEIDRKMELLKPKLKTKLDITQLMLVHDHPLSIRFRADEKQFDVDGAYDIRYEIVKKRIDKAYIKNTGERLTQPGKIAVVFNEPRVEQEYRRYFHYLQEKQLIGTNVEIVELDELQGATGLRAMRVEIVRNDIVRSPIASDSFLKNLEGYVNVN